MKTTKTLLTMLAAGAFALAANSSARASAELTITVGGTTDTYFDPTDTGTIAVTGLSIGGYTLSVVAGTSKPIIGSATSPALDIASLNVVGSGASPLVITFSDVGFGPTNGAAKVTLSDTALGGNQAVAFSAYGGTSNNLLDESSLLASVSDPGGSFLGVASGGDLNLAGPYSITEKLTITGAGSSSIDAGVTVPDGGSTVALLGLALVGVGCVRQKLSGLKALVIG